MTFMPQLNHLCTSTCSWTRLLCSICSADLRLEMSIQDCRQRYKIMEEKKMGLGASSFFSIISARAASPKKISASRNGRTF